MIRLVCEGCGRRLHIDDAHAGKSGRCPSCGHVVHVPESNPASSTPPEHAREPGAPSEPTTRDLALLDLPDKPPASVPDASKTETAEPTEAEQEAEVPARWADALLYPANVDGLVQIGILAACIWGIGLLGLFLAGPLQHYATLITLLLRVLLAGYILSQLGYCILDSAKGGRRVPPVSPAHAPSARDLFSQLLLLLASVAICFWPAGVYFGFVGHRDVWFWLLAGCGAFFLPMTLLTASLSDGFDALNPILIARSIRVTLPAYLILLVAITLLVLPAAALDWLSSRTPMPRVLANAGYLYLLMAVSHLLGRFYWRHKGDLKWGL